MKIFRIWFACSLGLALSLIFDWDFGFLAVLLPFFTLGKMDKFNPLIIVMIFMSALINIIIFSLIWSMFKSHPFILFMCASVVFLCMSLAMVNQKTFLLGFMGLLLGSIYLSLFSYEFMDMEDMSITIIVMCTVNALICSLACFLFPTIGHRDEEENKQDNDVTPIVIRYGEVIMVWMVVMIAFVIFQTIDLYDSSAAYASIIVILAPMTVIGVFEMSIIRVAGTMLGCAIGVSVLLVLGVWFEHVFLFWLLLTIAMGPLCYMQTLDVSKATISVSAMAALFVPLTTVTIPGGSDGFFSIIYRFSSIVVSMLLSVVLVFFISALLRLNLNSRSQ